MKSGMRVCPPGKLYYCVAGILDGIILYEGTSSDQAAKALVQGTVFRRSEDAENAVTEALTLATELRSCGYKLPHHDEHE